MLVQYDDHCVTVELYAESVRGEISQALGIPTSMYSVEDMLICRRAEKLGLPYPTGLVFYPTVRRELRYDLPQHTMPCLPPPPPPPPPLYVGCLCQI